MALLPTRGGRGSQDNHARLAELHRSPTAGVTVVSAHDPDLLAAARAASS